MDNYQVYKDIQTRTGGEVYLGVLGPVRTGKSTFIKRFMNLCVIPGMTDVNQKERTIDELPLSGAGSIITTVEPKFIPKEAAEIVLAEDVLVKLRLIDSVGYLVDGAMGHVENDKERMVRTPWQEEPVTFRKAAEMGTRKVMEHSTIGIVITTDGTIGAMEREAYETAEKKTVEEMKQTGKPFVILLNSSQPYLSQTQSLAERLRAQYEMPVISMNCEQLRMDDVTKLFAELLQAFPITELHYYYPEWVDILPEEHPIRQELYEKASEILHTSRLVRDMTDGMEAEGEYIRRVKVSGIHMENGVVEIQMELYPELYYQALSEMTGSMIRNEYQFVQLLRDLVSKKTAYEKVEAAMRDVETQGYSIVMPDREEIALDTPEIIRHGNKYGVKLRAVAPGINLIHANIVTEIAPIVGSEEQAMDLIQYMEEQARNSAQGIWETNIFGKSILELVEDGIKGKAERLTRESRLKLQNSMEKIINENNGGIVCIII